MVFSSIKPFSTLQHSPDVEEVVALLTYCLAIDQLVTRQNMHMEEARRSRC
jgi:hypothetical protein